MSTATLSWARSIEWSGYRWQVRSSENTEPPGPNVWSDSTDAVWVDEQDRLHLRVRYVQGQWRCAEVTMPQSLGHGSYVFYLDSPLVKLDPNVVVGLFTYLNVEHELDVEISKWGQSKRYAYCQYTVHPDERSSNMRRRWFRTDAPQTTHSINWNPDNVTFSSYEGHSTGKTRPFQTWRYTGQDNPEPSFEKTHINLWLLYGHGPTNGQPVELIVDRFEFIPHDKP